jgi:hypothetical protein
VFAVRWRSDVSERLNAKGGGAPEFKAFLWNSSEGIQPWMDLVKPEDSAGSSGTSEVPTEQAHTSSFWLLKNFNSCGASGEVFNHSPYYGLFRWGSLGVAAPVRAVEVQAY